MSTMTKPRETDSPALSADLNTRCPGNANPFVFIVGCPRSGTTLVQRIVDAHPDVAICDETFWLAYFFKKRLGLTPEGWVTPELISRLLEYHKFYRMRIGRDELELLMRCQELQRGGDLDFGGCPDGAVGAKRKPSAATFGPGTGARCMIG